MKIIFYCSTLVMLLAFTRATAQINFKTEYISTSTYKNKEAPPARGREFKSHSR